MNKRQKKELTKLRRQKTIQSNCFVSALEFAMDDETGIGSILVEARNRPLAQEFALLCAKKVMIHIDDKALKAKIILAEKYLENPKTITTADLQELRDHPPSEYYWHSPTYRDVVVQAVYAIISGSRPVSIYHAQLAAQNIGHINESLHCEIRQCLKEMIIKRLPSKYRSWLVDVVASY